MSYARSPDGVTITRNAARHLRDRCHSFVIALRDGYKGDAYGSMAEIVDKAIVYAFRLINVVCLI
jgi:hypothetical protein